jgi:predicted nucleic acid-binding protein
MKGDKYFLDTNILVYAHDSADSEKQKICQKLIFEGIAQESAALSTQVLGEFIVTVTRKISPPLPFDKVNEELEALSILPIQGIDLYLVRNAFEIQQDTMISYWDALIVAAARSANCSTLYSEDLNSGQVIAGVEIVNPFEHV